MHTRVGAVLLKILKNRRFSVIRISSKWITINFKTINMSMIKVKNKNKNLFF